MGRRRASGRPRMDRITIPIRPDVDRRRAARAVCRSPHRRPSTSINPRVRPRAPRASRTWRSTRHRQPPRGDAPTVRRANRATRPTRRRCLRHPQCRGSLRPAPRTPRPPTPRRRSSPLPAPVRPLADRARPPVRCPAHGRAVPAYQAVPCPVGRPVPGRVSVVRPVAQEDPPVEALAHRAGRLPGRPDRRPVRRADPDPPSRRSRRCRHISRRSASRGRYPA